MAKLSGCLAAQLIGAASLAPAAQAQSSPSAYLTGYRYQMGGLLVGVISPAPSGSSNFPAVRNTYDSNGRLSKVETGVLSSWQSDTILPANWSQFSVSRTQTITYDSDGRKIQDTFVDNTGTITNVTQYSYDSYNHLQCTAVRMYPASFGSQPNACLQSTNGPNGPDRITQNVYDTYDNVTQVQKAVGTSIQENYVTYTYAAGVYTAADHLVQTETDANGNETQLTYDGDRRLTQTTFPSKTSAGSIDIGDYEAYTYDNNGNRLTLRKRDGTTISYAYDALNRMTSKTLPVGNPTYYAYDNRNLVLSQVMYLPAGNFASPASTGIFYQYDSFGRKTAEKSTVSSPLMTVQFAYDNDGDRTQIVWPDTNYYVNYGFDGLHRMVAACEQGSFNGNPASPGCSSGNQLATYTYDPLQRIASIQYGSGGANVGYTWSSWDDLQTLSHTFAGGAVTQFANTYNQAHQIIQSSVTGNTAFQYASTVSANTSYTPNGLNEYTAVGGQAPSYDNNGNLTGDGGGYTFTYDSENRVLSAATSGMSATYSYDPAGRRTQKQVSGGAYAGTTQFISAGDDEISDYDGSGNLLHRYIPGRGVDQPIAEVDPSDNKIYFHQDKTGSVIAMSNSSGAIVEGPYTYDPYGNCLVGGVACSAATSVAYKYTGRRFDLETGLYYYRARYYSPALGRFLQTDPIGYKDDMALYAYTKDDPTDSIDPSGTQTCIGYPDQIAKCQQNGSGDSDSDNRPKPTSSSKPKAMAAGGMIGTTVGVALSAACDVGTDGLCVPANPTVVGASASAGAATGAAVGALIDSVVHGNSMDSLRLTYVYQLIDQTQPDVILKYGITSELNPLDRYSNAEYAAMNARMQVLGAYPNRLMARVEELILNGNYVIQNEEFPRYTFRW